MKHVKTQKVTLSSQNNNTALIISTDERGFFKAIVKELAPKTFSGKLARAWKILISDKFIESEEVQLAESQITSLYKWVTYEAEESLFL